MPYPQARSCSRLEFLNNGAGLRDVDTIKELADILVADDRGNMDVGSGLGDGVLVNA
jgi:hypothetical protein